MKRGSVDPIVPVIHGNLLNATEQYIAQQCNCYTIRSHGLAAAIAKQFGPVADPYANRKPVGTRNLAVEEDRDTPGTIRVLNNHVICMFAQLCPGKPLCYKSYPNYQIDTAEQRVEWFKQCLVAIETTLGEAPLGMECKSIAFPWTIGCGLAGGDWTTYRKMIEDFAQRTQIVCVIYKL